MSNRRAELIQEVLTAGRELSTAAVMFHSAMAEKGGLSITESKALDLLDRLGPLTAGQLAEHSGLAPASVTGLVDRLEAKGVARRVPHPRDRRRVLIETVDERVHAADGLFDDFVSELLKLCEDYTDTELATVIDFIRKAARVQQAATARLTAD